MGNKIYIVVGRACSIPFFITSDKATAEREAEKITTEGYFGVHVVEMDDGHISSIVGLLSTQLSQVTV